MAWFLAPEADERFASERDYHERTLETEHRTRYSLVRAQRSVSETMRELVERPDERPRGILVQATDHDGLTWFAEAALREVASARPDAHVHVFRSDVGEDPVPQLLAWIGRRHFVRSGQAAGLLGPRRTGFRIVAALGFVVGSAVAALPTLGVAGPGWLTNPAFVLALGSIGLWLVDVAKEARSKTGPRNALDRLVSELNREGVSRGADFARFVQLLVEHIEANTHPRIVATDDIDRLSHTDRAVLERLLRSNSERSRSWEFWIVCHRASQRATSVAHVLNSHGRRTRPLTRAALMTLPAEARAELFAHHHPGALFDPRIEAVKHVVQRLERDEDVATAFAQALQQPGRSGGGTTPMHLLWLLAVGATAGIPARHRTSALVRELASTSLQRHRPLAKAIEGRPTSGFVQETLEALLREWPEVFEEGTDTLGADWLRVRPQAARAIVETARQASFSDHDSAAAYWAMYWHDRARADSHPARLEKLVAHLTYLIRHVPRLDVLDSRNGGRLSSALLFAIGECLASAQLSQLTRLLRGVADCAGRVSARQSRRLAAACYQVTHEPEIFDAVRTAQAVPNAGSTMRRRFDRMPLTDAQRHSALTLLISGRDSHFTAPWELEEHAFQAMLRRLSGPVFSSDSRDAVTAAAEIARLSELIRSRHLPPAPGGQAAHDDDRLTNHLLSQLALSTAVWAGAFTYWCDGRLLDDAPPEDGEGKATVPPRTRLIGLMAEACEGAQRALDLSARETARGASWPIAIDAAAQQTMVTCLLAVHLLQGYGGAHDGERDALEGIRRACEHAIGLRREADVEALVERTELAVLAWTALGLESLAGTLAARAALLLAAAGKGSGGTLLTASHLQRDISLGPLIAAVAAQDSKHLRVAYLAKAASTLAGQPITEACATSVAMRALCTAHAFQTPSLAPLLAFVASEGRFDAWLDHHPEDDLKVVVEAICNTLRLDTDPVVESTVRSALGARIDACTDEAVATSCRSKLLITGLEFDLSGGKRVNLRELHTALSTCSGDQWTYVLGLACAWQSQIDEADDLSAQCRAKLDEIESAKQSPTWNQYMFLRLHAAKYATGNDLERALDLLQWSTAHWVRALPIPWARTTLRLLERHGRPTPLEDRIAIDLRDLEYKQSVVFPALESEGRYFSILDAYVELLEKYGLRQMGTEAHEEAIQGGEEHLLVEALALGEPPRALFDSAVSAYFMAMGRAINAHAHDPEHRVLRESFDFVAAQTLPRVLAMALTLPDVPIAARRLIEQHRRAHDMLVED